MNGRFILRRGNRDEAEKPFWISYADLMTALMVLFLVVMSVALLSLTRKVITITSPGENRAKEIATFCQEIGGLKEKFPNVVGTVDEKRCVIDFGERARFEYKEHQLSAQQARTLREFIPSVLSISQNPVGEKWLKRIVVEGYTDRSGSYFYNLNLSLKRSQRILCVLLGKPEPDEKHLSDEEREQIRRLFLVGGYSYNSAKESAEESRRVELRFEFWGLDESRPTNNDVPNGEFGTCKLD